MLCCVVVNYIAGIYIDKYKPKKLILFLALLYNLGSLCTFKYINFFSQSILAITGYEPWPILDFLLPMGISFYTFQAMAYIIDVYRGQAKVEKNIINFALYITFFPQLVAGPIMKAQDLIFQFNERHEINTTRICSGFLLIIWGLSKKLFIADPMGRFVDLVYEEPSLYSGQAMLMATYAFAIQIFCDFSAYTDIAIGSARIFGVRLMENFRTPYLSINVRDFWRRWHISLSSWLRDYLYIPLGGNRKGKIQTYINLFITMLLGGLWHGANWNFVIWGVLHGIYLALERITGIDNILQKNVNITVKLFSWFITFNLICIAWIFFRAETLNIALNVFTGIFTWKDGERLSFVPVIILGGLLSLQILQNRFDIGGRLTNTGIWGRWIGYIGLTLCVIALVGGQSPEFIYFQF
jgi:D-alanyl-lipoteichoic acid acyltransferase DltB (MBOAT superfamily)